MKNKIKIIGFGASILLIFLALMPTIYASQTYKSIYDSNGSKKFEILNDFNNESRILNLDKVLYLYELYKEDIKDLEFYLLNIVNNKNFKDFKRILIFSVLHSTFNFKNHNINLPFELQEKIDNIRESYIDIFSEDQNQFLSKGGITKIEFELPYFWLIFPGVLYRLWFNHQDSSRLAGLWEVSFVLTITAISTYLGGTPGAATGLAISLILIMIKYFGGVNTNPFELFDQGNGVFLQFWQSLIPGTPFFFGINLFRFESQ